MFSHRLSCSPEALMIRRFSFLILGLALGVAALESSSSEPPAARRPLAIEIRLENEAITPVTARFIERALEEAEKLRAEILVIVLDTPGGLVDSTRQVVRDIIASNVPVAVHVAPAGARAASAGLFITLAAHVAAMAPGTNIGAAHPVAIGGPAGPAPAEREPPRNPDAEKEEPGGMRRWVERALNRPQDNQDGEREERREQPIEQKILEDTVAWARALAELRGRNAEWAARAVRQSISAPASEAVEVGAVDLLAADTSELLDRIDGREVELPRERRALRTAGAEVRRLEMWWGERLLSIISNPNIAFLLMIFGFYGILFELYSPGWGIPGTLGIVCLLLAFFGLAVLPTSITGLALILLALALFVAEVFVTSFGLLSIAGALLLILGGILLVDSPAGFQRVSLAVIIPVAVASAFITLFLVGSILRTHRGRVQTGGEGLMREKAIALQDFAPREERFSGTVRTHGEIWKAISPVPVQAGEPLEIVGREGLTLEVAPSKQLGAASHEGPSPPQRPGGA
jgi:membrane-bound serine protease (ClpP class)